jgi:hypothetical protein
LISPNLDSHGTAGTADTRILHENEVSLTQAAPPDHSAVGSGERKNCITAGG